MWYESRDIVSYFWLPLWSYGGQNQIVNAIPNAAPPVYGAPYANNQPTAPAYPMSSTFNPSQDPMYPNSNTYNPTPGQAFPTTNTFFPPPSDSVNQSNSPTCPPPHKFWCTYRYAHN